jgi:UDP-2,3-diacylglucosamine hydrolase
MDVNADAVVEALRSAGYPNLIHGHTHRPARHSLDVDGHSCERWVLHDWHARPEWLEWTPGNGLRFRSL